ncbi:hypothetical protein GCM10022270_07500 [Terriglobus aquaticus]
MNPVPLTVSATSPDPTGTFVGATAVMASAVGVGGFDPPLLVEVELLPPPAQPASNGKQADIARQTPRKDNKEFFIAHAAYWNKRQK